MTVPVDRAWLQIVQTEYPALILPDVPEILQGHKSQVLRVRYQGQDAVLKHYNARSGTSPNWKKGKELAFLRAYAETGVVPQILEHRVPEGLIITYMDGTPLSEDRRVTDVADRVAGLDVASGDSASARIEDVSRRVGRAHGYILSTDVPAPLIDAFRQVYSEGHTFRQSAVAVLEEAERLCHEVAIFAAPIFRRSVHWIRRWLDAAALAGPDTPTLLYKEDWSPRDILLRPFGRIGFVDFDQSYEGPRVTYLGAVVDHLTILDWSSLRRGLEVEMGATLTRDELEAIYVMALYNVWLRVVEASRAENIGFFTAEVLQRRFAGIEESLSMRESLFR